MGVNKKKFYIGLGLLILFVAVIVNKIVYAKYIEKDEGTSYLETTDFIYECNLEDGKTYYINPSNVPSSIDCLIVNYVGSNISQEDITGTIKLTKGGILIGATYNFNMTKDVEEKQIVKMPVSALVPGEVYTMEVKTDSPYIKTITSTFIVSDYASTSTYSIVDEGGWVKVEIKIGSVLPATGITINYSGLAPDNTNELMSDWLTSTETNVISNSKLETNSIITLIFIKENIKTYESVNNETLTGTIDIQ